MNFGLPSRFAFPLSRPALAAGGLTLLVLLSGCSSTFLGGSGVLVPVDDQGNAVLQAVPEGTDPDDAMIGLREHPRIIAAYGGVYEHRRAELMLARVVSRLLAAAGQPNVRYTVTILDTPQVNAFALPGGYVYVTRGLLALASDEAELAAVLAHEIAHVTLRHARARSNRQRTSELVDRVITGVFGADLETDQGAARARLSLAAFSQSQELEADVEGVMIAGRAGYDPHAAARFLATMARFSDYVEEDRQSDGDFLSSHPSTPDRIETVIETARSFGAPGLGEINRAGYLASVEGVAFGTSPSQGVIIAQSFVHPELKFIFTAPQRYALQNTQGAVVGVASDGEALRFDSADVPADMALTDYLKSGWVAGLNEETVESRTVNGIDMAIAQAQTSQWAFRVAALRYEGEVYRFIFAAREDTTDFANAVQATINSFRATRQTDLAQIRAVEIEIVTASAGDSTQTLAGRMQGVTNPIDLFNLLNGRFSDDPLVPGERYKIVTIK